MAPNPKVKAAFTAMKDLGISEEKVKPVLKKLLKLYEKNWELIEAENYRALLDGIFDAEDATATEEKRKSNVDEEEEEAPQLQRPLKRLRKHQDNQATPSVSDSAPPLLEPKLEEGEEPQPLQVQKPERNKGKKALVISGGVDQSQPGSDEIQGSDSSQLRGRDKGKGHSSSKTVTYRKRSRSREIRIGSGTDSPNQHLSLSLIIPKDEPFTDDVPAPLAVIPPDPSSKRVSSVEKDKASGSNGTNASVPLLENGESRDASIRASSTEKHDSDHGNSAFSLEVASSPLGDVNLTLNCKNQGPGFHTPSLDAVLKLMDEKSLQSYKTLYPNFSITTVTKLMTDICQCFLELGTVHTSTEDPIEAVPRSSDSNNGGNEETLVSPTSDHCHDGTQDGGKETDDGLSENAGATEAVPSVNAVVDNTDEADGVDTLIDPTHSMENNRCNEIVSEMESECSVLPVVEMDKGDTVMLACEEVTVDVTDGEERVSIGWINELNQQTPPPFQYTPQNLIFCKAAVTFSLSQISEENCCSTCSGDCVSNSTPCGCARANGGKYAYTVKGLLSEEFLDECISMAREPQKFGHFFCKQCPLQVSRNEALEPCKGHEKRNFIKECWRKCRCSRRCNNRVVQRGITCSLQVFMTSEGKGWGVRTLQDLPKGTFVCEYVGEILTHKEALERNVGSGHHGCSYQVFLDSAWDSISPEDNEALCLDSTCYGNIARFINHRCFDANLIGIPVEVETPKHHYYHLAFFTTRNVQALEELTWDYGVDFDDDNPCVSSFKCLCGSQFCRNLKRSNQMITQT